MTCYENPFFFGNVSHKKFSNNYKKLLPEDKNYVYESYQGEKQINPCHWPWSGIVINWDGNVSPCCIVDSPQADFGNCFQTSIFEIWNNHNYQSARAEFVDHSLITNKTICNICKNQTHNKNLKRVENTFALTL